jgi:hypothetical protein
MEKLRPNWDADIETAQERATENGTNLYEEMENAGYTRDEIIEEEADPYSENSALSEYLGATDTSLTNEEAGLDENGEPDDA